MSSTCEMYVLNDGSYMCGNCGHVHDAPYSRFDEPRECEACGAKVTSYIEEGEQEDAEVYW